MQKFLDLTAASKALYVKMLCEAEYENYEGDFNMALMDFTPAERGNLSDLKKKNLVVTYRDEDTPNYSWVEFVDVELAKQVKAVVKG